MALYQIVEYKDGRWHFVAHGARYEKKECDTCRANIEANGRPTKALRV